MDAVGARVAQQCPPSSPCFPAWGTCVFRLALPVVGGSSGHVWEAWRRPWMSEEMLELFSFSTLGNICRILCVNSCKFTKPFHTCVSGLTTRYRLHSPISEPPRGGDSRGCFWSARACSTVLFNPVGSCEPTPPPMLAGEHGLNVDRVAEPVLS